MLDYEKFGFHPDALALTLARLFLLLLTRDGRPTDGRVVAFPVKQLFSIYPAAMAE